MAFLNPSLLMSGTTSLDTATPLEDYRQQMLQKKQSNAQAASSQFDMNNKKYNILQNSRASLLADPTMDNFKQLQSNLQASNMFNDDEMKSFASSMPQSDAGVQGAGQTASMYMMPNGEQLKAAAPKSEMIDLKDRSAQVLTSPLTGQQQLGAQYRKFVSPDSLSSYDNNPALMQQSQTADPRIYGGQGGGSGAGGGQPGMNLGAAQTSWNQQQPAGSNWGGATAGNQGAQQPGQLTLADLHATARASGHPIQHVMRTAKALGWRVVR